jgi:hypothetical protein
MTTPGMWTTHAARLAITLLGLGLTGCAVGGYEDATLDDAVAGEDLALGEFADDEGKADGTWGAATTCKEVPNVAPLVSPRIVVSLDGLTLHLWDAAGTYDRVFPIGPGAIDQDPASPTYGSSLSFAPLRSGKRDFEVTPATTQPCKIWWKDPATRQQLPVFAGLPFLSWSGNYGIHGPIDNYRAPNGGTLRRGFVSHGCIRMASADILEVYARTRRAAKLPVHVQREPERKSDGVRVDLADRWIGSECTADSDCNFAGGICHANAWGGRSFCTMSCTSRCPDRVGAPTTFCTADSSAPTAGICVPRAEPINRDCRPYDHFVERERTRFGSPTVRATVCVPGSPGWVGDRCLRNDDCLAGATCDSEGVCSMPCTTYCDDEPGSPTTFCAADSSGGRCRRQCDPLSNGSECAAGFTCERRARPSAPGTTRNVCVPE